MARAHVRVPRMLAPFTGDQRDFWVEASTVGGALDAAKDRFPLLRTHLEDESGARRPHVSIFYNDKEIRTPGLLAEPLHDGDEIIVLQAISGGQL